MIELIVGCYGKLPLHGDFIRFQPGPEIGRLDDALQAGMLASQAALGERWRDAFHASPPLRFLRHYPDARRLLGGVIVPSRDKPGRDFPFLVCFTLDDGRLKRRLELAPLLCEAFWERAEALAAEDWSGRTLPELYEATAALSSALDVGAADARLSALLASTPLRELLEPALGGWDERRFLLLLNAASLFGPRARPRFALTLPKVPSAEAASLWLAIVAALRGKAALFPPLLTWDARPGPESAGLRCVLVEPAAEHYTPLFLPGIPNDACELANEGLESASLLEKARGRFGALAERGEAPLRAALAELRAAAG